MKKILLMILVIFSAINLYAQQAEGTFGIDGGYTAFLPYMDGVDTYNGFNVGIHYEPPLMERLNLVVSARSNFHMEDGYNYYLPEITVGSKFLMDVYTVLPYMEWGIGAAMGIAVPDEGDSVKEFGIALNAGLGADYYVSDDFSMGIALRYDHIFNNDIPDTFTLNIRVNFITLN